MRRRLRQSIRRHPKRNYSRLLKLAFVILLLVFVLPFVRIFFGPMGGFGLHAGKLMGHTFLVLLQNEAELRPSGGFISAFAVVQMNGLSPQITVHDSYFVTDPKQVITAPKAISDAFSSDPKFKGWVFRDANFFPDFAESARQSLVFLKGDSRFQDVDFAGVISVNFAAFERLYTKIGAGAKSDNLFLALQRETKDIDLHSLESLENRKNGLQEAAQEITDHLGYFSLPGMLSMFAEEADKKDIQFWFEDSGLQRYAERKGWTGKITGRSVFGVNIANLGAKKSDRYVQKTFFSDLSLSASGELAETFRLLMKNIGDNNLLSGEGSYYIRIIRPVGTKLKSDTTDWEQRSVGYGEEFATQRRLAPGQTIDISVQFDLPDQWTTDNRTLAWIKQSGTDDQLFLTLRGEGETAFAATGCDRTVSRENVLYCSLRLTKDTRIVLQSTPDTLPPILENAFFKTEREISVRFSEKIKTDSEPNNFNISCGETHIAAKNFVQDKSDLRDATVVLASPVKLDGAFCRMEWKEVADLFNNKADITMTIPLKTL